MVSRLSDTRMQLSVMDKQKADAQKRMKSFSGRWQHPCKGCRSIESVNALVRGA